MSSSAKFVITALYLKEDNNAKLLSSYLQSACSKASQSNISTASGEWKASIMHNNVAKEQKKLYMWMNMVTAFQPCIYI